MSNNNLIKCKTCGEDMAKSAKACPKCGAKNKKPFYLKKRFYALLLVVIIIASFFAYRTITNNSYKATITDKQGNVSQMLPADLENADKTNAASYNLLLQGADVVLDGKVKRIESNVNYTNYNFSTFKYADVIVFEGGWKLIIPHNSYDLSTIKQGDSLHVESNVWDHGVLYSTHSSITNIK